MNNNGSEMVSRWNSRWCCCNGGGSTPGRSSGPEECVCGWMNGLPACLPTFLRRFQYSSQVQ